MSDTIHNSLTAIAFVEYPLGRQASRIDGEEDLYRDDMRLVKGKDSLLDRSILLPRVTSLVRDIPVAFHVVLITLVINKNVCARPSSNLWFPSTIMSTHANPRPLSTMK